MKKIHLLCILMAAFCALSQGALAADAFSSDWAPGLKSSARLIAAGPSQGAMRAGVEIKLAAGAITYWRNPGDAGLPPTLSFEGSQNLAQARTSFPAPQRLSEGDGEAFGYDHNVILPIDVEPIDPSKPVTLAVNLDYAVCEKVCVPAQAKLHLILRPNEAQASPFAQAIAAAEAQAPRTVDWESLGAELTATGDKTWRLCLPPQAGPKRDLFIEPPQSWWFDVKPDAAVAGQPSCFQVKLMQQPPDATLPVVAQLTVTGGGGAIETSVALRANAKL